MTAAKLFPIYFGKQAIRNVYNERLAESSAVGTDGVTGKAFAEQLDAQIDLIHRKITLGTYKFTRYKEKLVSRG